MLAAKSKTFNSPSQTWLDDSNIQSTDCFSSCPRTIPHDCSQLSVTLVSGNTMLYFSDLLGTGHAGGAHTYMQRNICTENKHKGKH